MNDAGEERKPPDEHIEDKGTTGGRSVHTYPTSSSGVMEADTPVYGHRGGFGRMLKPAKFLSALERVWV
ncbi:hypothetical protein MF271_23625 (plasmid) [Deinococcus sp. KNUC1210]|uniref:hypothetical protein n=1 Tax=Deinococcus sp. KNUC1210 TaxID=2917691 RepID=UPI001EF0EF66|nr:hypothetical protein [Deinococcus sp. KNUC1210]ULH17955.1 hypothetical protein MF271_23625 [Deinococcus sp. KNUC1210]